jgi:glycosyltransferase involved in cell wall biosynthesis
MNKLSVICSVYNSSKYLNKYLDMVNSQFLKQFEIIFVDANSTDDSLEIINNYKFREGINSIILSEKSRITIYEAWNLAINISSGDYVMNWNTDDLLFPNALLTYFNYVKKFPNIDLFYSPCGVVSKHNYDNYSGIYNWPEHSHDILLKMCICGPFPLVRKKTIEDCGYFDTKYVSSSDYDMWLKISKNNYNFKKIPDIIGSFFHRPDSISNIKLKQAQIEDAEIQKNHII